MKGKPKGDLKVLSRIEESITKTSTGKIIQILGADALIRWRIVAYLIKKLQSENWKWKRASIYGADFNLLIQSYFKEEDVDRTKLRVSDLIWIRLDFVRKHEWTKSILLDLLCCRHGAITLLTCSIDFGKVLTEISVPVETFDIGKVKWTITSSS